MERELGYRVRELITLEDGTEFGVWMSVSIQGHEIIYVRETLPGRGRLHHLAFWVGSREDVLRAADLIQDAGIFVEAGPAKHTPLHSFYLYVWEPGGNRIEVTSGGYFVFDPDAVATRWTGAEYFAAKPWDRMSWGRSFPETFDTYGTPLIEPPVEAGTTAQTSL
jgi:catechol 2,3-dioxygenase